MSVFIAGGDRLGLRSQKEFNVSQRQLANSKKIWYIIEQVPITRPGP